MRMDKIKKIIPHRLKKVLIWIYEEAYRGCQIINDQYTKLYTRLCRVTKNKIVFDNYVGEGYGDNPKYIAEEILRQKLPWDLVWLVNDLSEPLPKGIRAVKYGSNKALREISSAKVFVDNVRSSVRPIKKHGQYYLQTWHGASSFKCIEAAAEKLNEWYVRAAKEDGKRCDAILSGCRLQSEEYEKYFWLNEKTEILEVGLPRNDVLFNTERLHEKNMAVRKKLGIDNQKIVLYMPTFRDDRSTEGYIYEFEKIIQAMERRFQEDIVVVIRMHPNVRNQSKSIPYGEKIFDGTDFFDSQELYIAADYLITDYSSVAFDFSLLERPVFLCMLDFEKYKSDRGLTEVFDICPFPKTYSVQELMDCIESFSVKNYHDEMEKFKERWQPFDNGNASELTVEWLKAKVCR